ncbi:MAG: hypothetical protein AAF738_03725 [Bacteroidota bacterium]
MSLTLATTLIINHTHSDFVLSTFFTGDTTRIVASMFIAALMRLVPLAILQSLILRLYRQSYWSTWGLIMVLGGLIPVAYISNHMVHGDLTTSFYHSPYFITHHAIVAAVGMVIPQWWLLTRHHKHAWVWLLLIPLGLLPIWLIQPVFASPDLFSPTMYILLRVHDGLMYMLPPILLVILWSNQSGKRKGMVKNGLTMRRTFFGTDRVA